MRVMCITLVTLCLWWGSVLAQTLAFPSAEGFGRFSKGGRGGKAININSLSAGFGSGGSCNAGGCSGGTITFADCMTDRFGVGARTCIFRVSGVIDFNDAQNPWQVVSNVTVAGQTAPGNGIMIRNLALIFDTVHDIIMRHTRHRNRPGEGSSFQVVGGLGCVDCIFDHLSMGWNSDDGHYCSYSGADRCTFQWVLSTEGVQSLDGEYNKCCGVSTTNPNPPTYGGVSFLHNFYAQYQNRVPWQQGSSLQWINNIVYNVGDASAIFANDFAAQAPQSDWENNYYSTGPQQPDGTRVGLALASSCHPPASGCTAQAVTYAQNSKIYLSGNYQNVTRPDNTYPEDAFIVRWYTGETLKIVTTKPAHFPAIISMTNAQQARTDVLAKVGAYAVAGGSATVRRDAVDQRALDSLVNNTGGSLTCTALTGCCSNGICGETGSYPAGTPYTDTDGDGIPDSWELTHSLDPTNPSDGPALAVNGYTNLENFLNELAGDLPPSTGTILPPQLYLHWRLDDGTGSTAADATGHNYVGTLSGSPPWVPGHVPGAGAPPYALTMDGATSYVHNDTMPWPANQPITVSVWVNTAGGIQAGAFNIGGTSQRAAAHIPYSDNVLYWDYGPTLQTARLSTNFAPFLNQWTHVVLTANAQNARAIWINGVQKSSATTADAPTAPLTGVDLGRYAVSGLASAYQSGQMDDFRLYTYVLSDTDIQALYRQTAGRIRHRAEAR